MAYSPNWHTPCAHNPAQKTIFHQCARDRLARLAFLLGLTPGQYDLRTNVAGIAVSGETTLHADRLYVQVSQSAGMGPVVLFRTCNGRTDYTGDTNNWAEIALLDDLPRLVALITPVLDRKAAQEAVSC